MTTSTTPPASTWEPGEPLYDHPRNRVGGTYVRELMQLCDDDEHAVHVFHSGVPAWMVKCPDCLVGWAPEEGPHCWVCGVDAPNYDAARRRAVNYRAAASARLDGGPEVRYIHLETLDDVPEEVRLPVDQQPYTLLRQEPTETNIRVAVYRRSHFDYGTRDWVYHYSKEET